jgi:phage-related holin
MIQLPFDWLKAVLNNVWHFAAGLATTAIGYFIPVKDIVHLVLFFFLLDIAFGAAAAKKLRKERFSTKIIWNYTMPRILISLVLILTSYMWDTTFNQEWVSTYKLIGWFICGILLYSIAKNGYKITKWRVFPMMGHAIEHKMEEAAGVELNMDDEFDQYLNHGIQNK